MVILTTPRSIDLSESTADDSAPMLTADDIISRIITFQRIAGQAYYPIHWISNAESVSGYLPQCTSRLNRRNTQSPPRFVIMVFEDISSGSRGGTQEQPLH
jgi:hypothetical protein